MRARSLVFLSLVVVTALSVAPTAAAAPGPAAEPAWFAATAASLEAELAPRIGEAQRDRLRRGMAQVARLWRPGDGDAAAFSAFVKGSFAAEPAKLDILLSRLERVLESVDGHLLEIVRDLRWQSDLDIGAIEPFDETLAGWDPSAHVLDDLFANKIAQTVLLNFPVTTLADRLRDGDGWTRRQWAEARLVDRFARRVPAEVSQAIAKASADADRYVASYNVYTHHLVDAKGTRLFPAKQRLLSHWNIRDEIKASYADSANGLAKQRTLQKVMERIVTQTIPAAAVNSPWVDWDPFTNAVVPAAVRDVDGDPPAGLKVSSDPEPDTRYATLLSTFRAARLADPYSPSAPTLIARRFDEGRQIPLPRVKAMLEEVLGSPLVKDVAKRIEKRLGRPLQPFDVWYGGFRPRAAHGEAELDALVRRRYPNVGAFQKDLPVLLEKLGFTPERAAWLAQRIEVDPARGSGHAWGAARKGDKARLRTRIGKDGMDYKGFNIAVHELGHNVEQTFSLELVDRWLLQGVPNTAFTEALAFVFQGHDLELLGLAKPDARSQAMATLDAFWGAYEISGVALVDMAVWQWMYDHPDATPAQLKEATLAAAKDVWNRWYAPAFGVKDVPLLAIYAHMVDSFLYLPDYPIGHLIAHQIERQMDKAGNLGAEFERMARIGNVAPDLWMRQATGAGVGAGALLAATRDALTEIDKAPAR